jgi:hypothetical protein
MMYYEPYYINKILYSQHQIRLPFLNVKSYIHSPLAIIHVSVTTPQHVGQGKSFPFFKNNVQKEYNM